MNNYISLLACSLLTLPSGVFAADTVAASPSSGLLKMMFGLIIVLAVMAALAWLMKRMLPGAGGQQSVVRIVGGVSVGSRERVVVVQVADRWIVVGVAPGQVNGIANLDAGSVQISDMPLNDGTQLPPALSALTQPFAQWLKKSSDKFTEKTDVEK